MVNFILFSRFRFVVSGSNDIVVDDEDDDVVVVDDDVGVRVSVSSVDDDGDPHGKRGFIWSSRGSWWYWRSHDICCRCCLCCCCVAFVVVVVVVVIVVFHNHCHPAA